MKTFLLGLLLMNAAYAEEISVKVNGMVCSMCAQGIQKKFKTLPQVKNLDVNLETKMVKIQSEGVVSDNEIKNLIQEAGYNVERIERK